MQQEKHAMTRKHIMSVWMGLKWGLHCASYVKYVYFIFYSYIWLFSDNIDLVVMGYRSFVI